MSKIRSVGDRLNEALLRTVLAFLAFLATYPFLHVVFMSLSDGMKLTGYRGLLLGPRGFSLLGYTLAFSYPGLLTGYLNTLFYVVMGTFLNLLATSTFAYVLANRFYLRKVFSVLVIVTMFFSGGLIPTFLVVKGLGLYNTRWAILLPVLISTWNLIILRGFFQSIPESIVESARLDGAHHGVIYAKIILPLSGPVMAVMVMYYGLGHWNSWFNAMVYLQDKGLWPLQLFLREILIQQQMTEELGINLESSLGDLAVNKDIMKAAVVVISTLPVLSVYPFLQRHFEKGILLGSLKG